MKMIESDHELIHQRETVCGYPVLAAAEGIIGGGEIHGHTPLKEALFSDNQEVARLLLEHGANENQASLLMLLDVVIALNLSKWEKKRHTYCTPECLFHLILNELVSKICS
jgi:hypothetical protein